MSSLTHQWMNTKHASRRQSRRCLGCRKLLQKGVLQARKSKARCPSAQQSQSSISPLLLTGCCWIWSRILASLLGFAGLQVLSCWISPCFLMISGEWIEQIEREKLIRSLWT